MADISGHCPKGNGTCPNGDGTCPNSSTTADDVIRDIDQLRRDLAGYHGQLVAHNELERHCENQRKRIGELEVLYAGVKAESAKLRELVRDMYEGMCDVSETWAEDEFSDRMRDLGIEVDG